VLRAASPLVPSVSYRAERAGLRVLQGVKLECVRGPRRLFSDFSFDLHPGELLWVTGPNGAGKTSLLRIVCTLLPPEQGEVRWRGTPVRELGEAYRAEQVYVGHLPAVKDDLTACENLHFALAQEGIAAGEAQLMDALDAFGLAGREDVAARALSQGQRRRVALARLWFAAPQPLWILDEPLTALDVHAVELMRTLIAAHLERGGLVLLTSHQDIGLAGRRVQRVHLGEALQ
jgi:heme exporter protein A